MREKEAELIQQLNAKNKDLFGVQEQLEHKKIVFDEISSALEKSKKQMEQFTQKSIDFENLQKLSNDMQQSKEYETRQSEAEYQKITQTTELSKLEIFFKERETKNIIELTKFELSCSELTGQ